MSLIFFVQNWLELSRDLCYCRLKLNNLHQLCSTALLYKPIFIKLHIINLIGDLARVPVQWNGVGAYMPREKEQKKTVEYN
jgi:hypothetical protein